MCSRMTCVVVAGLAAGIAGAIGAGLAPSARPAPIVVQPEDEMMAAYMKAGQPGPHHDHLKQFVGTWDAKCSFWHDPAAPAHESTGTMTASLVFGGRYLKSDYKGEMDGQEFQGISYMGYNNIAKRYEGVWIDSMSSAMGNSTGSCDPAGRVFTSKVIGWDPMTGKEDIQREVMTVRSNSEYTLEWFKKGEDGKDFRTGQIIFTRR